MSELAWKADLENWALAYCESFRRSTGRLGVVLGGSIARGQQWEHSDLEVGYLLTSDCEPVDYFAIDAGRGVERIPLGLDDLEHGLSSVDRGDLSPIVSWPTQLYRGRAIHDPTGLLGRMLTQFDDLLFSPPVVQLKIAKHLAEYREHLAQATAELAADRPRAAMTWLRWAMNDLVLAQYWAHGELPRSQNRTDSRLRELSGRHGLDDFYALYREVNDLDSVPTTVARDWPIARDEVLAIAGSWRPGAGKFFEHAVDSTFSWGEDGGIIGVYRMYIPIVGESAGPLASVDDEQWVRAHPELLRFLGLEDPQVERLLAGLEAAASVLEAPV